MQWDSNLATKALTSVRYDYASDAIIKELKKISLFKYRFYAPGSVISSFWSVCVSVCG